MSLPQGSLEGLQDQLPSSRYQQDLDRLGPPFRLEGLDRLEPQGRLEPQDRLGGQVLSLSLIHI